MSSRRDRLDVVLVAKGYFPSRERARAAVIAGYVFVNGRRAQKPGQSVSPADEIAVQAETLPYVSRGGLKLAHALKVFHLDISGMVVLDVGASTGGFTDCALQAGARRVFAVDVGYGQLAWKLRTDPRVTVIERTNIRYLEPEALGEQADFATVDVSFISLEKVLPPVGRLLKPEGKGIALIKPQFEAGPEKVGKKGVVRDPATHVAVCMKIVAFIRGLGWEVEGLAFSPVRGPEGNIEFFVYFAKTSGQPWEGSIEAVVTGAWEYFEGKGFKGQVLTMPAASPSTVSADRQEE
uniref:TlyA family RNA methyltransferase n=1 Tax=Ammonifex degensii TaxID=42838 RepID=A0A7C2IWF0_9THEO